MPEPLRPILGRPIPVSDLLLAQRERHCSGGELVPVGNTNFIVGRVRRQTEVNQRHGKGVFIRARAYVASSPLRSIESSLRSRFDPLDQCLDTY